MIICIGGYNHVAFNVNTRVVVFVFVDLSWRGRSLACSCTPLALSILCSPAPLSSLRAVVSDESSNEDGGDWPGPGGWHGGCGEMSGGVEIAFYFNVVCASPPSLCAASRRAIKNKSTQKRAGVSWWSCPGPRMTKGTRKIASKNHRKSTNAKPQRF